MNLGVFILRRLLFLEKGFHLSTNLWINGFQPANAFFGTVATQHLYRSIEPFGRKALTQLGFKAFLRR